MKLRIISKDTGEEILPQDMPFPKCVTAGEIKFYYSAESWEGPGYRALSITLSKDGFTPHYWQSFNIAWDGYNEIHVKLIDSSEKFANEPSVDTCPAIESHFINNILTRGDWL